MKKIFLASTLIALAVSFLMPRSAFAFLDLTTAGASGTINGGFYIQINPSSTGTGVIDSFVRLSAKDTEQAYNTSGSPVPFDGDNSPFTRDLLLSEVPIVNLSGTDYRQFLLDINQSNPDLISLDQIKIYLGTTSEVTSTDLSNGGPLGTLIYSLDGAGDTYIKMDFSLNHGSGSGDMFAYIPNSLFTGPGSQFVYLYSQFGTTMFLTTVLKNGLSLGDLLQLMSSRNRPPCYYSALV